MRKLACAALSLVCLVPVSAHSQTAGSTSGAGSSSGTAGSAAGIGGSSTGVGTATTGATGIGSTGSPSTGNGMTGGSPSATTGKSTPWSARDLTDPLNPLDPQTDY